MLATPTDLAKQLGKIRYTAKDYASLRKELVGRIPLICVGTDGSVKWTDYNSSDIGITLLELFTGASSLLLFTLDVSANEAMFINARMRKNVMAHAKTIGYRVNHVVSSTALVTLRRDPHSLNIEIPKYTPFKSTNPVYNYSAIREYIWPAGEDFIQVGVKQGTYAEESFVAGLDDRIILILSSDRVGQNTVEVEIDGFTWEEVRSFVSSEGGDKHYVVETDSESNTRVFFGDGVFGSKPLAGTTITVKYLISSGEDGNVGTGMIRSIGATLYDTAGVAVTGITVSNEDEPPVVYGTQDEPFTFTDTYNMFKVVITKDGVEGDPQEFEIGLTDTTAAEVAARIMLTAEDFIAEASSGSLKLTMVDVGPSQVIQILDTEDDAYDVLGFRRLLYSGTSGAATGGTEREDIDTIKRQAPAALQALDRAVTRFDYQALMNAWPGISKSQCWGENEENPPNYDMFNRIKMCFIPEGGGPPSETLKDEIVSFLEDRKVVTTKLTMLDPVFVPVTIEVILYLNGGYDTGTVISEVNTWLNESLDEDNLEFEEDIHRSNIVRMCDNHIGVHHCLVTVDSGDDEDLEKVVVIKGEIAVKESIGISAVGRAYWTE
jgi:hypothetical protein